MNSLRRFWRRYYEKFISLSGDPRNIAKGFAIGTFISFNPLLGTHTILSLVLANAFRTHLGAMLLGSWFGSNPITYAPSMALEFYIGSRILGHPELVLPEDPTNIAALAHLGWEIAQPLFLGFVIVGAFFAIATYPLALWSMRRMNSTPNTERS